MSTRLSGRPPAAHRRGCDQVVSISIPRASSGSMEPQIAFASRCFCRRRYRLSSRPAPQSWRVCRPTRSDPRREPASVRAGRAAANLPATACLAGAHLACGWARHCRQVGPGGKRAVGRRLEALERYAFPEALSWRETVRIRLNQTLSRLSCFPVSGKRFPLFPDKLQALCGHPCRCGGSPIASPASTLHHYAMTHQLRIAKTVETRDHLYACRPGRIGRNAALPPRYETDQPEGIET